MNTLSSIDLNNVTNGFFSLSEKSSEGLGRGFTLLKSGSDAVLPYLQDKRLAVVSLIGVTILLVKVGALLGRITAKCMPRFLIDEKNIDFVRDVVGIGTITGGVIAFSRYADLPLDRLTLTIISVSTFFFLAWWSDRPTTLVADATF